MKGATWNAERDRDPAAVRRALRRRVRRHDLDFVLLQEFNDYLAYFEQHPIRGYILVCPPHPGGGDDQNPILVRESIPRDLERVVQLSRHGWVTVDGHQHAPVYAVTLLLGDWLRVASIHAPVTVSWPHGEIEGPELRVAAYRETAVELLKLAHRTGHHLLLGGDWNAHTWEHGEWSPAWLAEQADLEVVEPAERGGPGHRGIDYVLSDARVTRMRKRGTGGSDHPFVTFRVRRRGPRKRAGHAE